MGRTVMKRQGRLRELRQELTIAQTSLRVVFLIAIVFSLTGRKVAQGAALRGLWRGPVGIVKMETKGGSVVGRLQRDSKRCSFKKGDRVLEGTLAFGNFSGKLRLCSTGCEAATEQWGFAMLVVSKSRLSGAAALKVPAGCSVPGRSEKGAVVFQRVKARSAPPLVKASERVAAQVTGGGSEDSGESAEADDEGSDPSRPIGTSQEGYDPRAAADVRQKAMNIARDGANYLQEGRFEEARARFQAAVKVDPSYAEGFNGIGVSYAMRRDWVAAAKAYQRSIGAGPDLGDAYYNLACAYAQTGKADMAVRYLRIAVLNGYSDIANLLEDPDLAPIRKRADFKGVIALGKLSSASP